MLKRFFLATTTFAMVFALTPSKVVYAQVAEVKNIVLVHGTLVDGSVWKPDYDILTRDGYKRICRTRAIHFI